MLKDLVSEAEYIKRSDVTLGDKRKFVCMSLINLIFFALQMATIVLTAFYNSVDLTIFNTILTPITMNSYFLIWQWALVFLLQFFFVIIPMPCMKPG